MARINESIIEDTTLDWLKALGYEVVAGPSIAPDEPRAERVDYKQVILEGRLKEALKNITPDIPPEALDEAFRKITRTESPSLTENNRRFHRMLTDGVDVSYMREGMEKHDKVWLLDLLSSTVILSSHLPLNLDVGPEHIGSLS